MSNVLWNVFSFPLCRGSPPNHGGPSLGAVTCWVAQPVFCSLSPGVASRIMHVKRLVKGPLHSFLFWSPSSQSHEEYLPQHLPTRLTQSHVHITTSTTSMAQCRNTHHTYITTHHTDSAYLDHTHTHTYFSGQKLSQYRFLSSHSLQCFSNPRSQENVTGG